MSLAGQGAGSPGDSASSRPRRPQDDTALFERDGRGVAQDDGGEALESGLRQVGGRGCLETHPVTAIGRTDRISSARSGSTASSGTVTTPIDSPSALKS